jgi:hypothetical protein
MFPQVGVSIARFIVSARLQAAMAKVKTQASLPVSQWRVFFRKAAQRSSATQGSPRPGCGCVD